MVPSNSKYSNYNDYDAQGAIIQELRLASRVYSLPVISITQNVRSSENAAQDMNNQLIGDSYKKIRYSDYVYMVRLRYDLELLAPQLQKDVYDKDQNEDISFSEVGGKYIEKIVAFEIKITKAKEGRKDIQKFHLFSGTNLKIYDMLSDFFMDLPNFKTNSGKLSNNIDILGMNTMQQIVHGENTFELDIL